VQLQIVKHEKHFFVQQHVATWKHQKGIEKRKTFVWPHKVIFSEKQSYIFNCSGQKSK